MNSHIDLEGIYKAVRERLGESAEPRIIEQVVQAIVKRLTPENQSTSFPEASLNNYTPPGTRVIVSALGTNHPGIVAGIASVIAEHNGDIQDISQKILQEFFVMIMIVNIDHLSTPFNDFKASLLKTGETLGIKLFIQHEDIFRAVNRV